MAYALSSYSLAALILLVTITSVLGWGVAWNAAFRQAFRCNQIFEYFWSGLVIFIAIIGFLHRFYEIAWQVVSIVIGVGMILFFLFFLKKISISKVVNHWQYFLTVLILSSWIVGVGMRVPDIYDTGLYHLQSIKWLNSYPLIEGLGNLHGRLAFNQAFFYLPAALNYFPIINIGHQLAMPLIISVACAHLVFELFDRIALRRLLALLLLIALLFLILLEKLTSPSPDSASLVLQLIIVFQFSKLYSKVDAFDRSDYIPLVSNLILLSCLLITFKLSNAAFSGAILIAVGWLLFIQWKKIDLKSLFIPVLGLLAFSFVLLLDWLHRGYVSSGWILYPAPYFGGWMPFAISEELVLSEMKSITDWARNPDSNLIGNGFFDVFTTWLLSTLWVRPDVFYFPIAAGIFFLYSKWKGLPAWASFVPLLPIFLGWVYWAAIAPAPRFLGALVWLPLIGTILAVPKACKGYRNFQIAVYLVPFLGAIILHFEKIKWPSLTGFQETPSVRLVVHFLPSFGWLWTPAEGDQAWDAPLPSAPTVPLGIRMQGGSLSQGIYSRPPQCEASEE